ncbi:MAG: DUF938 domain-containing protein [Oligoflexia bacterium]|nr:DUF938 domain-containing protein [Oligoflexia bacterium]
MTNSKREIPFSQACENNKNPILAVFKELNISGDVLEIGHGTGQHALHFASNLDVTWQPADVKENNWMISQRELPSNILPALELEVQPHKTIKEQLGSKKYDFIFSANTLHIMSEEFAFKLCEEIHEACHSGTYLLFYGPFKFNGQFTSESNKRFDLHLKSQRPTMGIRNFEDLRDKLSQHFEHLSTIDMPANNNILVFKKL